MEFIKQYWYVFAGLAVLLLIMQNRSGSGPTLTAIGTAPDALSLANLQSQEALASDAQKLSFVSNLLNYDLSLRSQDYDRELTLAGLKSSEVIARENARSAADAQAAAYSAQQAQANLQYQLQMQAMRNQRSSSNNQAILSTIFAGLDRFLPLIFNQGGSGNSGGSGGGWGFPRTTPGWGGGWSFGW